MRFVNSILSVAILALLASSCNSVDFKKTKGGMPYKYFSGNGKVKAENGQFLKVHYTQKLNDSVLVSTYTKGLPVYIPINSEGARPYDPSELFATLKEGDSIYAVQLVDTFLLRNSGRVPPEFKRGDKLYTSMKVLGIIKSEGDVQKDEIKQRELTLKTDPKIQEQLKKDDKLITEYFAKNNIKAEKTGLGTYVQTITQGNGPKVVEGKDVSVKYKGATFEGKVFDTNMDTSFHHTEPYSVVIGKGGSIWGFEEGLKALSQGTKARLFIPSSLAYGENPQQGSPFKPNEILIFDIDVLEVKDAASPVMPPPPHPVQKSDGKPSAPKK